MVKCMINDEVNHPARYTQGKIEVIDFIEDQQLDFSAGNVVKYLCRYQLKGGLEDLEKARWYLNRLIKQEKALQSKQAKQDKQEDEHE
jgi:hypothetical protein